MIKIVEFYKEIRAGSSLPLIVGGSDGHKYVIKLRGSGEGVLANVVEFLSLKLGRLAQIPVLEPVCLFVETDFAKKANDPEIGELLNRLDMLRILRLETEEERRLRALQNKQAFEQKFGKL